MASLNPYLNFNGNTEEAFEFYRSVFGGDFIALQRFKDTPEADRLPREDLDKIMHIALSIGDGHTLMATDTLESLGQRLRAGNNFYISISADSEAEAAHLYHGLSADGHIELELQKTFWGAYFGMFKDKFGIQWMVNFDYTQK